MLTCHMYIQCHVCAPFVYRNGSLVNLLAYNWSTCRGFTILVVTIKHYNYIYASMS